MIMWKYREPVRSQFDCDEDYETAIEAYWNAVDDYCDMCEDDRY